MGKKEKNKKVKNLNEEKKLIKTFMEIISGRMLLLGMSKHPTFNNKQLIKSVLDEIFIGLDKDLQLENILSEEEINKFMATKDNIVDFTYSLASTGATFSHKEIAKEDKSNAAIINSLFESAPILSENIIKSATFFFTVYNKIISIMRYPIENEKLTSLEAKLLTLNENKENFDLYLESIAFMFHLIALRVFLKLEKVSNRYLNKIKIIDDSTISVIYSNRKIIDTTDLIKYKANKNMAQLFDKFVDSFNGRCYDEYLGIMGTIYTEYRMHTHFKDSAPKVIYSDKNVEFPFIQIQLTDEKVLENKQVYLTYDFGNELLMKTKDTKKYAMPTSGCKIRFKDNDKSITEAIIKENEKEYIFEIFFKDNSVLNEAGESINKGTFFLTKDNLYNLYYILNNNNNFYDSSEMLSTVIDPRSQPIDGPSYVQKKIFIISINIFMLSCLYVLHIDINNKYISLENIYEETERPLELSDIVYKTSTVRRLAKGRKASSNALKQASEVGVLLPKGYTLGKEFSISK